MMVKINARRAAPRTEPDGTLRVYLYTELFLPRFKPLFVTTWKVEA